MWIPLLPFWSPKDMSNIYLEFTQVTQCRADFRWRLILSVQVLCRNLCSFWSQHHHISGKDRLLRSHRLAHFSTTRWSLLLWLARKVGTFRNRTLWIIYPVHRPLPFWAWFSFRSVCNVYCNASLVWLFACMRKGLLRPIGCCLSPLASEICISLCLSQLNVAQMIVCCYACC